MEPVLWQDMLLQSLLSEGVIVCVLGAVFGFFQHKNARNIERQNENIKQQNLAIKRQTRLAENKEVRDTEIGKLRVQKDRVKDKRDRTMDDFLMTFSAAYLEDDKETVRKARETVKEVRRDTFVKDDHLLDDMLRVYEQYDKKNIADDLGILD